jgi:SAM-dependent methyltransferase
MSPALRARDTLAAAYRWMRTAWYSLGSLPGVRGLRGRQLRRLHPLAGGRERGQPVVRHYWEQFLSAHTGDLRGRCLEIGTTQTLGRLGGPAMQQADAMDMAPRDGVTVVADLSRADAVASGTFDAFVVPFTMHLIYDVEAALHHAIRILKPGGVLLVNFPCVDYYFADGLDMGTGRPLFVFWWFTPIQVENLLRRAGLAAGDFSLSVYGNLFARVAYQMNLPAEELTATERDHRDAGHPLLICARIVKPEGWAGLRPVYQEPWLPTTKPATWNRDTGHYPGP